MPADPERLQAVVSRLSPLSNAATGDLIRAQDWNALVAAVVDLARAVLAEGPATVPPHDHVGQVKSSWLDPRLATTLERGTFADPEAASRLGGAERAVTAVDGRLTSLTGEITQLRMRLNEALSRDLERQSQVSALGLRVSTVKDSTEDVQALRSTLTSVQDALGRALTVAQQLTVNGAPVDIGKMGQRIGELETFREGLRSADGALVDAARLRADLQAATATLVSKDQLASALEARATALTPAQLATISSSVSATLRSEFTVQFTQLGDALRAETTQRLTSVNDLVAGAVADSVPSVRDAVLVKLRPEIATAVSKSAADQQARTDQGLADTTRALRAEFDGKLTTTRADLTSSLTAEVGRQVSSGLAPVLGSLADLGTKLSANAASIADLNTRSVATADALTKLSTSVTTVGQRVDAVAAADASARTALEASLRTEFTAADTRISSGFDSRLTALDSTMNQRLADTATSLRTELRRTSVTTTTGTSGTDPRILVGGSTRITP